MQTLGQIAMGIGDMLGGQAAEGDYQGAAPSGTRPRETLLSPIHLEHMLRVGRLGARIMRPIPAFYDRQQPIDDLVDHWWGGFSISSASPTSSLNVGPPARPSRPTA